MTLPVKCFADKEMTKNSGQKILQAAIRFTRRAFALRVNF